MGQSEEFYMILVREEKDRGFAVGPLFRRLRRHARASVSAREGRAELAALADELADSYERNEVKRCCSALGALGLAFARSTGLCDADADLRTAIAQLMPVVPEVGVALWYLLDLDGRQAAGADHIDYVDLLLGIYLLSRLG